MRRIAAGARRLSAYLLCATLADLCLPMSFRFTSHALVFMPFPHSCFTAVYTFLITSAQRENYRGSMSHRPRFDLRP